MAFSRPMMTLGRDRAQRRTIPRAEWEQLVAPARPSTGDGPAMPGASCAMGVMVLPGVPSQTLLGDAPGRGVNIEHANLGFVAGVSVVPVAGVDPAVVSTAIQAGAGLTTEAIRALPRRKPARKPRRRSWTLRPAPAPASAPAAAPDWGRVVVWGVLGALGGLVAGRAWRGGK